MVEIFSELTDQVLKKIVKAIDDGKVVAFPTETVYAVAADAAKFSAVEKIYNIKRRFNDKPLPVLVGDIYQAKRVVEFDERAKKLALHFFPGPITLVLKTNLYSNIASNVNQNLGTIGIRMPDHLTALKIIKAVGRPLVGSSANISNEASALCAQDVLDYFGDQVDILIDQGVPEICIPSTIVDLTGEDVKILRDGAIPRERIEEILGVKVI